MTEWSIQRRRRRKRDGGKAAGESRERRDFWIPLFQICVYLAPFLEYIECLSVHVRMCVSVCRHVWLCHVNLTHLTLAQFSLLLLLCKEGIKSCSSSITEVENQVCIGPESHWISWGNFQSINAQKCSQIGGGTTSNATFKGSFTLFLHRSPFFLTHTYVSRMCDLHRWVEWVWVRDKVEPHGW